METILSKVRVTKRIALYRNTDKEKALEDINEVNGDFCEHLRVLKADKPGKKSERVTGAGLDEKGKEGKDTGGEGKGKEKGSRKE